MAVISVLEVVDVSYMWLTRKREREREKKEMKIYVLLFS
jgi:hypothetical protein